MLIVLFQLQAFDKNLQMNSKKRNFINFRVNEAFQYESLIPMQFKPAFHHFLYFETWIHQSICSQSASTGQLIRAWFA